MIRYLERLIETPNLQGNFNVVNDYNKDYTALLLNCYVKLKQNDKISQLIEKAKNAARGESIFDINTAIDVCRQQPETMEHAEKLAEFSENYQLLVQI